MPYQCLLWFLPIVAALAGCASRPGGADSATDENSLRASAWAQQSGVVQQGPDPAAPAWFFWQLPGKSATQYSPVVHEGRPALRARSDNSASVVRQKLNLAPEQLGTLRFSWFVQRQIAGADVQTREADDAPVRVMLAFEGDRSKLPVRYNALSDLALALTGERLPYATLMYVWSERHSVGSVVHGARTDRVRKLVLASGANSLGRWLDYERDVRADFERAFGEPPGALIGIALMTDSDNTQSRAEAWYGPLQLQAR